MLTLAQAQLLTQDKLWNGIIDEFRKDRILDMMIFDDNATYNGGSTLNYAYNRTTTQPTAEARAINGVYTDQETVTSQELLTLKVLGGSFKIDRVIANYVKGIKDQTTFQIEQKIKAVKALFSDMFINGDKTTDSKQFDGIDKLITDTTTVDAGGIDLSTSEKIEANYKKFADMFRDLEATLDEAPSAYLVSKLMYATIQKCADRMRGFSITKDNIGAETIRYNGVEIVKMGDKPGSSNPIIATYEAKIGSATSNTTGMQKVYAIRIGLDACHAVSPQSDNKAGFEVYMPDMKSSDEQRRGSVEMVTGIAIKATKSCGMIKNIKIA